MDYQRHLRSAMAAPVSAEKAGRPVMLLLRQKGIVNASLLNRVWLDVPDKVLDRTVNDSPPVCYGFEISIPLNGIGFQIGFEIDGIELRGRRWKCAQQ